MHLIISKWYRIQKYRHKRKTISQKRQSERANCQPKGFYSINHIIDHAYIHFFFYVNNLHWKSSPKELTVMKAQVIWKVF